MKPKSGYCINCDNRHGCKSKPPPCIDAMTENNVTGFSGKEYLLKEHETARCRDCPFFRSCWKAEEYERLMI
jgi:hypothetical protein